MPGPGSPQLLTPAEQPCGRGSAGRERRWERRTEAHLVGQRAGYAPCCTSCPPYSCCCAPSCCTGDPACAPPAAYTCCRAAAPGGNAPACTVIGATAAPASAPDLEAWCRPQEHLMACRARTTPPRHTSPCTALDRLRKRSNHPRQLPLCPPHLRMHKQQGPDTDCQAWAGCAGRQGVHRAVCIPKPQIPNPCPLPAPCP